MNKVGYMHAGSILYDHSEKMIIQKGFLFVAAVNRWISVLETMQKWLLLAVEPWVLVLSITWQKVEQKMWFYLRSQSSQPAQLGTR